MITTIDKLKKGDQFLFNDTPYIVKQKFSDWQKNGEPYMKAKPNHYSTQIFWSGTLEVTKI